MTVCFIVISYYYYKEIDPLLVWREMPFRNKVDKEKKEQITPADDCKHCYFRGINFLSCAAEKHIKRL